MALAAMESLFELLDYPNITQFWYGYSIHAQVVGVALNLLKMLWSNEMELGQNGPFYGLWVSSRTFNKHWAMIDKKASRFHVSNS